MKCLPNLRRDLTVRHLVGRLDPDDPVAQIVDLQAAGGLALALARAKDQDLIGVTDDQDDGVVVIDQLIRKTAITHVFGRGLGSGAGETHMPINV